MRCRLGIGERAVGKVQSLVDPTEHPQCEGVVNLRCGARILTEPVGEITMARLVVELDGLLKMVMSAGKVAEAKAVNSRNAMSDQGLRTIRLGCGFAQEKLRYFAHPSMFATDGRSDIKTVIGGKSFGGVFHPTRQFAGALEGRARFRRVMSLGPDQRIAEADLEVNAPLAQRGGALHRIA